ncbi:hypothetical protein QM787_20175 [Rhodococcus ruber]|uniref:HicB family toxin-antitoxin system n=1 Tax=Rhodococcus ruber TaxID=1830 RepID=A0A098BGI3_9NOCA|nr:MULTISPECIES: hypothetical protein [Rhodococcus]MCD2129090.1 hypothetical protein [Rhodococcus ruber]MCZ4504762.1 hypothetical protein [Rhodococcus ruber]MCZ4532317.1 hypothetical protein [Rhodococcus ruber]MCZ4622836.1 hypothetical protein [Rhodococcus ruber]MDI9969097.1 hypothetical protein [Rhodococcus ruber]
MEEVKYTAQVTRDDGWWSVHVPEVDRTTQARHLREVKEMAADLVHIMTGSPVDEIEIEIELPEDLAAAVREFHAAQHAAEEARARAASAQVAAARALQARGATLRDIGEVLGVSFQRVHQLVNS